jgi:hypothetical protein
MSFTKEIWVLVAALVVAVVSAILGMGVEVSIGYKIALGVVIVGLLGVASVIIMRLKQTISHMKKELAEHKDKFNKFPQTKDIVRTHPLFGYFSQWLDFFNVKFHMSDKGKHMLFKTILINRFEFWRDALTDIYTVGSQSYVPDPTDYSIGSLGRFKSEALEAIDTIYRMSSEFYVSDDKYSLQDKETLSIAMAVCAEWHIDALKQLKDKVRRICDNTHMYQTYGMKNYEILVAVNSSLADLIRDAGDGINHLNGKLKGLMFMGIEIGE